MADAAIIFDVDGVLLEMTRPEEDTFFQPFIRRYGLTNLSRNWDSYAIRNDEEIVSEIFHTHSLPLAERDAVIAEYLDLLKGVNAPVEVPGTRELLQALGHYRLGIATANFVDAARIRLEQAGLWNFVESLPFGAEGGGHKSAILSRAIKASGLPPHRIVYVGDNLNDVQAGLENSVHFIGFSQAPGKTAKLAAAGARHVAQNHLETLKIVADALNAV